MNERIVSNDYKTFGHRFWFAIVVSVIEPRMSFSTKSISAIRVSNEGFRKSSLSAETINDSFSSKIYTKLSIVVFDTLCL